MRNLQFGGRVMDESLYTLEELGIDPPDISHIKVEDGAPVDGFPSEREMRLLVQILHVFPELFGAGRDFLAAANVGLFQLAAGRRRPGDTPETKPDLYGLGIWQSARSCG